jgi:hypothetical protein
MPLDQFLCRATQKFLFRVHKPISHTVCSRALETASWRSAQSAYERYAISSTNDSFQLEIKFSTFAPNLGWLALRFTYSCFQQLFSFRFKNKSNFFFLSNRFFGVQKSLENKMTQNNNNNVRRRMPLSSIDFLSFRAKHQANPYSTYIHMYICITFRLCAGKVVIASVLGAEDLGSNPAWAFGA